MTRRRWRTAAAVVAIPLFLAAYAVLAATIGSRLPESRAGELAFYFLAGLAWIPVVLRMIGWAARDPGGM